MQQIQTCKENGHSEDQIIGYCLNQNCSSKSKYYCFNCLGTKHASHETDCKGFREIVQLISERIPTLKKLSEKLDEYFQKFQLMKVKISKCLVEETFKLQIIKQEHEESNQFISNLDNIANLLKDQSISQQGVQKSTQHSQNSILTKANHIIEKLDLLLIEAEVMSVEDNTTTQQQELLEQPEEEKKQKTYNPQVLSYLEQGKQLKKQKKWNEAFHCYEEIMDIDAFVPEAHFEIGNILQNQKLYAEAIVSYDQAIAIDQNHAQSYSNKGLALINLQRYEEAIVALDSAIKYDPGNIELKNYKGLALEKLKRIDEAMQCYDSVVTDKQKSISEIKKQQ